MGLPDTSPVPKQDSMGMDYVPVYEGEEIAQGQININSDKVQKLGVKSEAAALRELASTLRVTGRVEINERHTYAISPKFEGWVERLFVNTTGQAVSKGQPLFEVYSPELVSAQSEYALAVQGLAELKEADAEAKAGMQRLVDASRARLKNWNMAEAQPTADQARVTFTAPVSGIVLEKKAVQGMRFMPGETLYQLADLSSLWVVAELNEQDVGLVQIGNHAQITVAAWPERKFEGKVDFIYPTLNAATRTVQLRIEVSNPQGALKPAMFANVQLAVGKNKAVLAVPISAVIDSGTKQRVLVRLADGRFEPRPVVLGKRGDDYVEVLSGIAEGEQVVTSANFLIDSESNLQAALSGMNERAAPVAKPSAATVSHQVQGVLEAVNADGTVSITHEPVAALHWPSMTMDFAVANASLLANIKVGSTISFEIVERSKGEWMITKLQAQHGGH
jgi:Cu(I)/Ag(I) efflux system membrane fusion protein